MPDEKKLRELVNLSMSLAERGDLEGLIKVSNEIISCAPEILQSFPLPLENRAMCYMELATSDANNISNKQIKQWLLQAKDDLNKVIEIYDNMDRDLYINVHARERHVHCKNVLDEINLRLTLIKAY